jgi:hypothetical protein
MQEPHVPDDLHQFRVLWGNARVGLAQEVIAATDAKSAVTMAKELFPEMPDPLAAYRMHETAPATPLKRSPARSLVPSRITA